LPSLGDPHPTADSRRRSGLTAGPHSRASGVPRGCPHPGSSERGPGHGPSSLVIVPTPWPSAIVAFTALLRFRKKVSFGSTNVSPLIVTAIVREEVFNGKDSVPVLAT